MATILGCTVLRTLRILAASNNLNITRYSYFVKMPFNVFVFSPAFILFHLLVFVVLGLNLGPLLACLF